MGMRCVDFITLILVIIILFSITNFIYSIIFIISFSLGFSLHKWFDSGIGIIEFIAYPLHGFTLYIAKKLDSKFNWFFKRFLMSLFSVLLIIILILAFVRVSF